VVDDAGRGALSWAEEGRETTAALAETWGSLARVCRGLRPADWEAGTACPGWTVRDQLSHLIGIERALLGEAPPAWSAPLGDHVRNEFAAANEPWVAVRRTRSGEAVRAEFVAVNGRRLVVLDALAEEDWARVGPSVVGDVAYAEFLRVRVFDSWVHEQDVRLALRRPGGSGGQASRLAIGRVQSAMGFVVGKKAAAPEGTVVRFSVTGPPDDARQFAIGVAGGRAVPVADDGAPTVTLTMSSIDFVRLGCGRATAGEVAPAVGVVGDESLGARILGSMNFMF
jgi:uncharacterized protein (TIGR03083 family)